MNDPVLQAGLDEIQEKALKDGEYCRLCGSRMLKLRKGRYTHICDSCHNIAIEPIVRNSPKIGRNERCPCGSGKKYKYCCLVSSDQRHQEYLKRFKEVKRKLGEVLERVEPEAEKALRTVKRTPVILDSGENDE